MKKILLILAVIGLGLTSCGKYSKKCKDAEVALDKATNELQLATNAYVLNPTTANQQEIKFATMRYNSAVERQEVVCH